MKKIFLAAIALTFSFGVFAQDTTTLSQHKWKSHEGIMMKNGKLMVMQNGQKTLLSRDTIFASGTTVSMNGTIKRSDGTTESLKNGEYINWDGSISKMKK